MAINYDISMIEGIKVRLAGTYGVIGWYPGPAYLVHSIEVPCTPGRAFTDLTGGINVVQDS